MDQHLWFVRQNSVMMSATAMKVLLLKMTGWLVRRCWSYPQTKFLKLRSFFVIQALRGCPLA